MELEAMWVHGLRRFGGDTPVKLRLDSHLVCLIGANEVGKSTLLQALEMAYIEPGDDPGEEPEVAAGDRTREEEISDDREVIRLRYRLGEQDRLVLAELEGAGQLKDVRWLERRKVASGSIMTSVEPAPVRDKRPRAALAVSLEQAFASEDWPSVEDREGTAADDNTLVELLENLKSNLRYLNVQRLGSLAEYLEEIDLSPALVDQVNAVVSHESHAHPYDEALEALAHRVPRFLAFGADARNLSNEYDLAAEADNPPPALGNLARLAEVDLVRLREKILSGESGTVQDTIDAGNEVLRERFGAWTQQPPVRVRFDHSGTRLFVHVKSGGGPSMRIRERSDGLRQFVALVALTAQQHHSVSPILLIDEAEMHLHYDAQADLLSVLTTQTAASQVIYTTHSAACLPEDLGSSVRVVHGLEPRMASTVSQTFWSEAPGLGALLMAMGAGSLAFVPLRPAVIVEGGGDLVLLPSLLKEALAAQALGYQVVPGAANVPPHRVAGLDLEGVQTVWILDGDQGGQDRRDFLIKQNIPPNRIKLLETSKSALDLEDLIRPLAYVAAVNAYAADVSLGETFTTDELPDGTCARHRAVAAFFERAGKKAPSKTAVANKVVQLRGEMPLLEPRRRSTLQKLHRETLEVLDPGE